MQDQYRDIRNVVRRYANERLKPNAARWDQAKEFPREAILGLGALGLFGITIPEKLGGAGMDYTAQAIINEEMSAGDCAVGLIVSVNNIIASILAGFGTEEQQNTYLAELVAGKLIASFQLSEPGAGSDASAIKTRAKRDGGDYVIDGSKQFITSGKNSDIAVVFAVTDPEAKKKGISAFLVPTSTPGYTVSRVETKAGMHASDTCNIVYDGCRIPAKNLIGEEGAGYRIALANLESGRMNVGAQSTGVAQAAFDAALVYARERKSMGKAIIDHQAVNFRLADMATRIEAGRQLYLHAAALRDAGKPCMKEASMAKLFCSEMAESVCSDAMQIHGGYGYLADFSVERLWRDVRASQIYEGTSDIQRLLIGRLLETSGTTN